MKSQKTPRKEIRLSERLKKRISERKKRHTMKQTTNFETLLIEKYGDKGTPKRDAFDRDSLAFRLGVM